MSTATTTAQSPPSTSRPRPGGNDRPSRAYMREELAVAKKYMGRLPWEMVAWGFGNLFVWLALWPLVFTGVLPLWAGFVLSTLCVILCYLPSHEAQHSIIAAEGTRLRWLNQLLGYTSTIPMVLPYKVAWITHRRHHAHANDPKLDPDHYNQADTWWQSVWRSIQSRQPGADSAYRTLGQESDDPEVTRAIGEAAIQLLSYYAILAGLAWSGYALEACFLWWLPRQLGTCYVALFLSWAPHHPMAEKGRYRDTRAWKSPIGTIATMGMEYHLIHHLYPSIPLFQTGPAYWDLREMLIERGIRNDGL